jgi:hypothetical protein
MIELSEMIAASDLNKPKPILGLCVPPEERFVLFKRLQIITNELQPIAQDLVHLLPAVD